MKKYSKHLYLALPLILCMLLGSCAKNTIIKGLSASVEELVADPSGKPVDNALKTLNVVISSDEEWHVTSNAPWLTTNSQMGGVSRTIVGIKVAPNFTNSDRMGELTFATSTSSVSVRVKQLGGETNINAVTYELPVIFHVFYNEADKNNTDTVRRRYVLNSADAQEILAYVNERYGEQPQMTGNEVYRGLLRKYEQGSEEVYHMPKKSNIRFVLANTRPDGKRQSPAGVETIKMDERSLDPRGVMNDVAGGRFHDIAWPLKDYINVFVFPFTRDEGNDTHITLGISHLPITIASAPITGLKQMNSDDEQFIIKNGGLDHFSNYNHCVVINSDAFEWRIWRSTFLKANLGKNTLAHELGHYLGLSHTFSETIDSKGNITLDSCEDTDYCKDTPSYNRRRYEDNIAGIIATGSPTNTYQLIGLLMRSSCSSNRFVSTNIMDYDYSYSDEFTEEQINRMRSVLYNTFTTPGIKIAAPKSHL